MEEFVRTFARVLFYSVSVKWPQSMSWTASICAPPSVRSKYDEWIPAVMMLDKTPENEKLQRELNYALTAAGKAEAQRKLAEGAFVNQYFFSDWHCSHKWQSIAQTKQHHRTVSESS
jgi:hypothetical protein